MPQLTPEQQKQYFASEGNKARPLSPLDWLAKQKTTPTAATGETPAGTLPPIDAQTGGEIGNLRSALSSALSEAAQQQAKSRMEALSGFVEGGAAPSVISAAVGLAQSGLRRTQEDIVSDTISGYNETQRLAEIKKQSAFNMMNTMIDNKVFVDTPAATLLAIEKEAGLTEGTSLAWQARLKIAEDQSDEIAALQIKKLRQDIADAGALSKPSNFINIMQETIDANGTPEQAAQEAARVSESLGIPVDQKTLNAWTEQARKLTKTSITPVTPPVPKTAYQRGQEVGSTLSYFPEALEETAIGKPIQAAKAVGSFFSGLFGL